MCKFCNKNQSNIINKEKCKWLGNHLKQSIFISLHIENSRLVIDTSSNYYSNSDCYYSLQGEDVDGKFITMKTSKKIKFCPMCGKKLVKNTL